MNEDAVVYIVDDDDAMRDALARLFKTVNIEARVFASPHEFMTAVDPDRPGCIILDLRMPELNGIEVLARLKERTKTTPVFIITGYGSATTAIRAIKLGAVEFFEKPVDDELLLERVQYWIEVCASTRRELSLCSSTRTLLALLSQRERQVLDCILAGMSNKDAARRLSISPKAIEIYRAHLMKKMNARSVVDLVLEVAGCVKCGRRPVNMPPCLDHWLGKDSLAVR